MIPLLAGSLGQAELLFTEHDRTKHDFELHVFEGDHQSIERNFKSLGIKDTDEIQAFDVGLKNNEPEAIERPGNVSKFKFWATQNIDSIRNTFCLMRFSFNSVVTGWVLYRFYDLTYLHSSSIISGALMGGTLSLIFMAYTINIDKWMMKSKTIYGQFFRFTLLSVIYMAAIKTTYLSVETIHSGISILTSDLFRQEILGILKGLMGSTAQMFFSFWNAYRKENRDVQIEASNLPQNEKDIELQFQRVLSKSTSLLNSIANNSLAMLMNVSHSGSLDVIGYMVTTMGGMFFLTEHKKRSSRLHSCSVALGSFE